MEDENDYYKVLNVDNNSTIEDIKKQYKILALKHHPDRNDGDDTQFKIIKHAYDILSDEGKREEYDNMCYSKKKGHIQSFFADILNEEHDQQKIKIQMNMDDIMYGCYKNYDIRISYACTACHETGILDPGKNTIQCRECFGRGVNPSISFLSCITCNGKGIFVINNKVCSVCKGNKRIKQMDTKSIYLRPGMKHNDIITISKSIILIIEHVFEDGLIKVDDMNIHINISITLLELLCGFTKEIKYAQESVVVRSDKVFDCFKPFIVKNKGINDVGDMYLHFDLNIDVSNSIYAKLGKSLNRIISKKSESLSFSENNIINIY